MRQEIDFLLVFGDSCRGRGNAGILMKCPKCGEIGHLVRMDGRKANKGMWIFHRNTHKCRHGWTHPAHSRMKNTYNNCRLVGGVIDQYEARHKIPKVKY